MATLGSIASLVVLVAQAAEIQGAAPSKVWWVFLERTKTPLTVSNEEGEKLQAAHIGNFKRLFGLKRLVGAGPLQDVPGGTKRGIVVLTVADLKAVQHCFLPDPYVQGHIFDVHAIPMDVLYGRFEVTNIDSEGIEENRLVVFTSSFPVSSEATNAHWNYVTSAGGSLKLRFAAASAGKDPVQGVAIFKSVDDSALQAWLDQDIVVKSGVLKATVFPQWLGKGSLAR